MYFRILKYIKPYYKKLLVAIFFAFIFSATNVYFIALVRDISKAIASKDIWLFNIYIIDTIGLYIVRLLSTYFQTYWMAYISSRLTIDLRVELYKHIQGLSLDFFEKYRQGDIISRVLNDIGAIENVIRQSFTQIIPQTLTLIGVFIYLVIINWKLTVLTFIVLPVFIYLIQIFANRIRKISSKIQRKNADIISVLQESIAAIRIVKAFVMENFETKRFVRENERNFKFTMRNVRISALQEPVIGFLQFLSIVLVIWYGGQQVVLNEMPVEQLIAFFTGILLLIDPVIALSKVYTLVVGAMASAERVFKILDIIPSVKDKKNAVILENLHGDIEFKDVSFVYPEGQNKVLDNINVKIKSGETVAIVGPSGAGKTTFVNLIPRFYDVSEGAILIDGKDVRDLNSNSYRSYIGIVPQETILFSGSVENNIAYGKIGASRKEVIDAAKLANADQFILKMKNGYVTRIGERGIKLSGGQKQRIAIARAILKDPKILILDEATSSLDNESEKLVQEALDRLMKNRTTLVIAHRLSTIINADRILVLDEGKIVESGSHKELLKKNGLYKKLYDMNFQFTAVSKKD
ncbi:MAG: ABC transporter ATP-binding protein [Candidatus Margulisbacteria bacterium]|nr:ABC transporter ATP-binding protein [Candidatus Margulisiibacteriota bacterium]